MENQDRSHSLFPITAVVLLAGVGTYFFFPQPFTSLRPEQPQPFHRHLASAEDIDARLWEDPFKPVHDHESSSACVPRKDGGHLSEDANLAPGHGSGTPEHHELRHLGYTLRSRAEGLRDPSQPTHFRYRIALLPVMVPGEPYAEQAEKRRRIRHAVLSGLSLSGFVPEAGESIGYVETCWSAQNRIDAVGLRSLRIPYEWFDRDTLREPGRNAPSRVLVLWLDEGALGGEPLAQVDDFLQNLTGYCLPDAVREHCLSRTEIEEVFTFRLIGPATSGALRRMVSAPRRFPPSAGAATTSPPAPLPAVQEGDPPEAAAASRSRPNSGPVLTEDPADARGKSEVQALIAMTLDYLDTPKRWLEDDVQREGLEAILLEPVGQALDLAREKSYDEALQGVVLGLEASGSSIRDSDPAWAISVVALWVDDSDVWTAPESSQADADPIGRQVELLIATAESYLDRPSQWVADEEHRELRARELRGPVAHALEVFWDPELDELVRRMAAALEKGGAPVQDTDLEWATTMARQWVLSLMVDLTEAGFAVPFIRPDATEARALQDVLSWASVGTGDPRPATAAEQLALDLCRFAFRPAAPEVTRRQSSRVPDLTSFLARICPTGKESSSQLGEVLSTAWRELKGKGPGPTVWKEWAATVTEELRSTAAEAGELWAEIGLQQSDVDARIGDWVAQNWDRLLGRLQPTESILPALQVYSSRATAAPALLLAEGGQSGASPASSSLAASMRESAGVASFVSTAVSDDLLAEAIVHELVERGVDVCDSDGSDHVALVGEWDTFYSRALTLALEAAIVQCRSCTDMKDEESGTVTGVCLTLDQALEIARKAESPRRIHRFHYLRGLDGSIPTGRGGTTSEERSANREGERAEKQSMQEGEADLGSLRQWRKSLERAIGPSQFDYMRRLAQRLTALDEELRGSEKRLAAVGVVGSDVYDKLLVLQALRPYFSRSLFFTTDLDARLCHPAEYRWTRNLLVASGFGLSLAPPYQDPIPPFRDAYQTSTFLAVRLALTDPLPATLRAGHRSSDALLAALAADADASGGLAPEVLGPRKVLQTIESRSGSWDPGHFLRPRLFEIARSGPYDISAHPDILVLHPAKPEGAPRLSTVAMASATSLLATILLASALPGLRRLDLDRWIFDRQRYFLSGALALTVLTALVVIGLVVWLDQSNGSPEPFELGEGISVWPTEGLRLLAALLSLSFLLVGWAKLRENERELARSFGLGPAGEAPAGDPDRAPSTASREVGKAQGPFGLALLARHVLATLRGVWAWLRIVLVKATQPSTYQWKPRDWGTIHRLRRKGRQVSVNDWSPMEEDEGCGEGEARAEPSRVDARRVWARYLQLGRLEYRVARLVPLALVFSLLGPSLVWLLGEPHKPFRGAVAERADWWILLASILGVILLTLFVVDATRLCERFVRFLVTRPTDWPREETVGYRTRLDEIMDKRGLNEHDASPWADLELIADRTEVVGRLIFYPFVILAILLLSRNRLFDNWDWPPSLVLIFLLAAACAVVSAVVVRRAAEEARARAVERLRIHRSRAIKDDDDGRAQQIQDLILEVAELQRGAFAHWSKHPVIKAVLLPFGGLGALALLELLSSLGL